MCAAAAVVGDMPQWRVHRVGQDLCGIQSAAVGFSCTRAIAVGVISSAIEMCALPCLAWLAVRSQQQCICIVRMHKVAWGCCVIRTTDTVVSFKQCIVDLQRMQRWFFFVRLSYNANKTTMQVLQLYVCVCVLT